MKDTAGEPLTLVEAIVMEQERSRNFDRPGRRAPFANGQPAVPYLPQALPSTTAATATRQAVNLSNIIDEALRICWLDDDEQEAEVNDDTTQSHSPSI